MSLQIDGSHGEGGGQILRTSVALAAITGREVELVRIRAGRSRPGLQPQHLAAVRAAAVVCAARLQGDTPGSARLLFSPGSPVSPGDWRFEIGTAGAATLVAQTAALPLALAGGDSRVTVTGGTHVPHAPPADFLEAVWAPALGRCGWPLECASSRAGFLPRGGGLVHAAIRPALPAPVRMEERGRLRTLRAFVVTAGLPAHVAERGAATIRQFMKAIGRAVEVLVRELAASGPGAAVVLAADCEGGVAGFSALGERGRPMERVAEAPCQEFLHWWRLGRDGAAPCVDSHLADQLVLPAALARGESVWTAPEATPHLRTALWVVERFLPVRSRVQESGGCVRVTLESQGTENR